MRASRLLSATLMGLVLAGPAAADPASVAPATPPIQAAPVQAAPSPAALPAAIDIPATPAGPAASPALTGAEVAPAPAGAAPAGVPAEQPAAAAPPPPPPEPTLVIDINLSTQRMTVSEHGVDKHTWPISSAAPGYRTPTGTFKPSWMSRMWYSRQYDWSPMPHSIFFKDGAAIHATQAIRQLGRPASHGCVRLAPSNAARLYKMVSQHGKSMTRIAVHGSPRHAPAVTYRTSRPQVAIRAGSRRGGVSTFAYTAPPQYYVPAKRRGQPSAYAVPKPRRYVSRGFMQGQY